MNQSHYKEIEQYLRKLMDDYETAGRIEGGKVVMDSKGGPSAWVWNSRSPRRWKDINISGDDFVAVLDKEGEKRMEYFLFPQFFMAINRKAWLK